VATPTPDRQRDRHGIIDADNGAELGLDVAERDAAATDP